MHVYSPLCFGTKKPIIENPQNAPNIKNKSTQTIELQQKKFNNSKNQQSNSQNNIYSKNSNIKHCKKTYKLTNQKNNTITHQHTKTHAEENMNKTTNVQQLNIQYMQQTTNLKLKTSMLHACRKYYILTIQKSQN